MKPKNCLWCLVAVMMIVAFSISFASCGDDDAPDPMLEVSPENLRLNDSGEGTLTITSNTKWEVSTTADWLSFSTMSGVSNGQVTVHANGSSTSDRTAIVTIKGEGISRQTVVTQATALTINAAGVTFKMILVEGGTFFMGATAEQLNEDYDWYNEKPAHSVTLSSYYIGETEVTQRQWVNVMDNRIFLNFDHPADYISWNECQEFITKLNALTGRTFRMPTEAEWEFAARGGTKSKGYKYAGSNTIGDVAWYGEDWYDGSTHDVAGKIPNELGLYDMSGNVWEWCSDWYSDRDDEDYYSNSPRVNPTGPKTGSKRVVRGGAYDNDASDCRVSRRAANAPDDGSAHIGIRLVLQ